MSNLVSVIVPSFNCERHIEETLGSVLRQSHAEFELIVVDDGSTDRTCELVAACPDPRVRLIRQQNARVSAARNRGLAESRGCFICFLDHDDYWFPDKLVRQVEVYSSQPEVGVVYGNFIEWYPAADGHFPAPESFDLNSYPEGGDPNYSGWIYHQFLLDCWMLTSTAMFRRKLFDCCAPFDTSLPYSEDWDLWLRLSQITPFLKLHRPNTLYRQHPAQGNRIPRPIDYRTRLLESAVRQWGYCSRDGRCTARATFARTLARYHTQYAFQQTLAENLEPARQSLLKAWRTWPINPKPLFQLVALHIGWRPNL